jgi:hypothetical protein
VVLTIQRLPHPIKQLRPERRARVRRTSQGDEREHRAQEHECQTVPDERRLQLLPRVKKPGTNRIDGNTLELRYLRSRLVFHTSEEESGALLFG